ncbi:nuclear transport factor 2 family protein [Gracilibacillus alcaliphilus]|uniref:nuclear transport factor 2 family protein n=1 Tax=Gracilibacillus alcaliphilus TaxID=1401441 RepID=UPI001957B137|nr:nuclear transport factor 2 family protein [Gracilibacillus alcaliphilus]MBM7679337.1 ketosteroid isomerase-like protein [Gracilibacillus alcaliphilus]
MGVSKELMQKINTAFATGDVDFVFNLAAEDIVSNEIGQSITEGKQAFIDKMEGMRGVMAEEYDVYRTVIEGNTAVVEGKMVFEGEEDTTETYFFCDWYTFESDQIKSITAFLIKQD